MKGRASSASPLQATLPLAIVPARVSPGLEYTAEQLRARDLFTEILRTGESMKVIGYAGAAKTTTLELLARSTRRRGLYLAFNRSTKEAARSRFPTNVHALTTHGLALRSIDSRFPRGDKLFGRPNTNSVVEALGLGPVATGGLTITARQQAASILAALTNFGNSASPAIGLEHVSLTGRMARLPGHSTAALADHVRRLAIELWARMTNPNDAFPLGQTG